MKRTHDKVEDFEINKDKTKLLKLLSNIHLNKEEVISLIPEELLNENPLISSIEKEKNFENEAPFTPPVNLPYNGILTKNQEEVFPD